ncbi:hypothetical protein GW17_00007341 [Ensete ventricosum]|nr:hypothetical protein GW17_00007341 [Ensete ventricosum]
MGLEPMTLGCGRRLSTLLLLAVALVVVSPTWLSSPVDASVSYDHKAIIIDGRRRILMSGSIHYPRSTPEVRPPTLWEMWPFRWRLGCHPDLCVLERPRAVPWSGSEITQPFPALSAKVTAPSHSVPQFVAFLDLWQYYFGGNYDLVRFIKLVKQAGLYVHLRIGPYVCAEWNFGYEIENEYGPVEYYGGAAAKNYVTWAARMAVGLNTGVPWVMCKQDDAPDPVVSPSFRFSCSVPPGRTPSSCSFSTFVQFNITLLLLYIPAAPIRVFVYACYTS